MKISYLRQEWSNNHVVKDINLHMLNIYSDEEVNVTHFTSTKQPNVSITQNSKVIYSYNFFVPEISYLQNYRWRKKPKHS